jgi:hypothetical protein
VAEGSEFGAVGTIALLYLEPLHAIIIAEVAI